MRESVKTFLKGLLMGAADIIPGVSGGTMALITGIYEKLILSINNILASVVLFLKIPFDKKNKKEFVKKLKEIEIKFLGVLVLGIAISFLTISRFILIGLEFFPAYIYSFFFGLILASAIVISKKIPHKSGSVFLSGALGFALALLITGIENLGLFHSLPIIFGAGFVAACAMLLPGVSGSFMLLLLGQYEYMLSALKNLELIIIASFLGGMILGGFSISKIVSHSLKKHKAKTLCFLVGLMFGALRLPLEKIINIQSFFWSTPTLFLTIASGIIGIGIVFFLEKFK